MLSQELTKKQINEIIDKIKDKSEGYMILLSVRKGEILHHTYFTNGFRKGDIMPSLDEHAKLMEPEVK